MVLISEIKVGKRFRQDLGNIDSLAESIQGVGLLHPIVISEDKELIAGYRRLEACKKLGWTDIPEHKVPLKDLAKGEFHENHVRKDFTSSERIAIKRVLEPKVKEEVKLGRPKKGAKLAEFPKGETRDIVAKYAGVSHGTLAKEEKIVEAAEKNPEKYGKLLENVDSGKTSVNYGYKMVKNGEQQSQTPPLPEGQFDVIYADPPWKYNVPLRGDPRMHYPTMPTEKICELKLPVAKDAILFLWATNANLLEALKVIAAWDFTYKTNMVWVKDRFGAGFYVRGQHELLLIAKKGDMKPPTETNRPSSVLQYPRKKHSEKPSVVYNIIEKMYPKRKYLELFARKKREGWVSWGNE